MGSKFVVKLKRIYAYLFRGFPFTSGTFDYEGYWGQLSQSEEHPVSPFKLRLIERFIDEGSSVLDIGCRVCHEQCYEWN